MAKFGTFLSVGNPANPTSGGFIYGDKFSAKAYVFYYRNKDLIKRAAYAFLDDTGYKTKTMPVKYARDLYYQQEVGGEVTFKEYYKLLSNEVSVLKGYSDNLHGATKNPIEHWIVDNDTNRIYLTLKTADRSKAEKLASDLNKKAKRERYIVRGFGVENSLTKHGSKWFSLSLDNAPYFKRIILEKLKYSIWFDGGKAAYSAKENVLHGNKQALKDIVKKAIKEMDRATEDLGFKYNANETEQRNYLLASIK